VNWSDVIFGGFNFFIRYPVAALAPAALFSAAFAWNRRAPARVAAIAWALYTLWEWLVYTRIACRGECNIRADLILLAPLLWLVSIAGVASLFMRRRPPGGAA
jgi:hypothetical protein